jgi:hypothetical protein
MGVAGGGSAFTASHTWSSMRRVGESQEAIVRGRRLTWALAGLTLAVLVAAAPGALRDAWERGGIYLLSGEFLEDLPRRLTGPGRFRFVFQPLVAILLGARAGRADALAGRPPFILAVLAHAQHRRQMLAESVRALANIVLAGILLDVVSQWLILGVAHPGAAIVVGPVLIGVPYAVARALSNRLARLRER